MAKISKFDLILRAATICRHQPDSHVILYTDFGILECDIDDIPNKPLDEMKDESIIKCALAIEEDVETRETLKAKEDNEKHFLLLKSAILFPAGGQRINIGSMTIFLDSVEAVSAGHLNFDQ